MGEVQDNDPEVKKETLITCVTTVNLEMVSSMTTIFEKLSSWYSLKKTIAWILKYRGKLLQARRSRKHGHQVLFKPTSKVELITVEETQNAKKEILLHTQRQSFPGELDVLRKHEQSAVGQHKFKQVNQSSSIAKLDPVLIDGLLRVGGRLSKARIPKDSKHQIILPKNTNVTHLINKYYHHLSGHSGRQYVIALLRRKYWIINANSMVRKSLAIVLAADVVKLHLDNRRWPICPRTASRPTDHHLPQLEWITLARSMSSEEGAKSRDMAQFSPALQSALYTNSRKPRHGLISACLKTIHREKGTSPGNTI